MDIDGLWMVYRWFTYCIQHIDGYISIYYIHGLPIEHAKFPRFLRREWLPRNLWRLRRVAPVNRSQVADKIVEQETTWNQMSLKRRCGARNIREWETMGFLMVNTNTVDVNSGYVWGLSMWLTVSLCVSLCV